MIQMLDAIALLSDWFMAMPKTAAFFIYGVLLTYSIAAGGYALARTGIKPLWILLLLVPTINVGTLWAWAYARWPALIKNT